MQTKLIGECNVCGGNIVENTLGNLSEYWCEREHIMVTEDDIVYPVDTAPDYAYENDPNAYGVFVDITYPHIKWYDYKSYTTMDTGSGICLELVGE